MDLKKEKSAAKLISLLKANQPGDTPVRLEGNWGSFARLLAAHVSKTLGRPIFYICSIKAS